MNPAAEFRRKIEEAGMSPPEEIEPGKWHRYPGVGKTNGNIAGFCKLFDDGAGGIFGDWSTGLSETWQAKRDRLMTSAEREAFRLHIKEAKAQAEADRKAKQAEAAKKALEIWDAAQTASDHGLRVHDGALVIPMRDGTKLHNSLQFIEADGAKRFLADGRVCGCYFPIGKPDGVLCITEGYATGASIHEATGYAVAVAFNAGNLLPVAVALRKKFADLRLVVCADDDYRTEGNPGLTKATEAARAVGGLLAVPEFGADRPADATDFNDLAQYAGLEAIARAIGAVFVSAEGKAQPNPENTPERFVLSPERPYDAATAWVAAEFTQGPSRVLHFWQGDFHQFDGACFRELSPADLRACVYELLAVRCVGAGGKPLAVKKRVVDDFIDALKAAAKLSDAITPPAFLVGNDDPREFIACRNGLLHVPTRTLRPAMPSFFTRNALAFDFNANAPAPAEWLRFLESIWADDFQQWDTLQEWFAYCLTLDTRQQKIFLIVGPKRSGKGTIARVLTALVGAANTGAPTLANLGASFGMEGLIGKQLAIISDARLGHKADAASIAENLLRISGEDHLSVPRKFQPDYTAQLPVRFMLMTNELPTLADASGALASRFVILAMSESFYGREDQTLFDRLWGELPGILNWALDGLDRLRERGHFDQPHAALHLVEQLDALGSPVKAFVVDCCEVGPTKWVAASALFEAWQAWCQRENRDHVGTVQSFGRQLGAAAPHVRVTQPSKDVSAGRQRRYVGIGLRF